ncbi:ribosome biogenesis protein [Candidatus Bathyarchaeota archaeon ex4484_205]|nr:MAG: ribosome biogenesis protein [Candidatus Bathyarchaeota archaeon ex4484_205]
MNPPHFTFVFFQSSIETIPRKLWSFPDVISTARRRGKPPRELILDRSLHHRAMKHLTRSGMRGRPDILHRCLLLLLDSPLNRTYTMKIYVHTINDRVFEINPKTRLPLNYNRFIGLMEQLFKIGHVPPENPLIRFINKKLPELIGNQVDCYKILFSSKGRSVDLMNYLRSVSEYREFMLFIGAYPRGPPPETLSKCCNDIISIYPNVLSAPTVTCRIISSLEQVFTNL